MSKTTKTPAASTVEFEQAVKELEKLCGKRRQPLKEAKGGFAFHLDAPKARSFKLDQVHADFRKRGCFVFDTDPAREKTRIAILPRGRQVRGDSCHGHRRAQLEP
jgi:hypothetical protein